MTGQYVIVVDLGSSSLRVYAVPVAQPWRASSSTVRSYGVRHRAGELQRSMSPAALRKRLLEAIEEVVRGISPQYISAIAVTAQRGGTAFLDSQGNTVYLGPNKDLRAVFEGSEIDESHGSEVHAATGHLPSLFFSPAKVRWWQKHRPHDAHRIAHLVTLGSWAVHALTGEVAETAASLIEAGLLNVATLPPGPANELLTMLGIDPGLVPPILPSGSPSGALTRDVARATGLRSVTSVFLAGPDAQAAMLGMGAIAAGDTGIVAGWSAPVQRVTKKPVFDDARRTWTGLHIVDDRAVMEANPSDTGAVVESVRRLLRLSHARFDTLASGANDDAEGMLAFWGPRALNLSSPGMSLGGLLTPSPVTHEGLSPGAIARTTLENVAFAIRDCLELLDNVLGANNGKQSPSKPGPVSLTGGMAQGHAFPSLLASSLGKAVLLHTPLATVTGAAIVASRDRREWISAAQDARSQGYLLEPDARETLRQEDRYQRWLLLRRRLDAMADEA